MVTQSSLRLSLSFAAVAAFFIVLATGCRPAATPVTAPKPQIVATSPVIQQITEWDEYVGRVAPIESVEVRARVSGHLISTQFDEGQIVHQGDLLVVIDQRPFQVAVDQAKAQLAGAQARAKESRSQLVQVNAEQKAAVATLELSSQLRERARRLVSKGAITQEELDIREANYLTSSADLDVVAARIGAAESAIVTADAAQQAASAALADAELNLSYTEVRAPINGRVSRRIVTDGNYVSGGNGQQGTILTTIVSLNPIHVYFDADEANFLKYERLVHDGKLDSLRNAKMPVLIGLGDQANFPIHGHFDFLDNRLDQTTGTMRGRGIFANDDLMLTPGLFARVRVPGSAPYQAVLIPDLAIGADQAEKFVLTIDAKNVVQRQAVELGPIVHGLRIVRKGLTGDEKIVLRGLQRVRPGIEVQATFEQTVAVEDGLPDEARPLPEEKWLDSPYPQVAQRDRADQQQSDSTP